MALIPGYVPTFIHQTVNAATHQVVTAERWNELFNLVITQGDNNAQAVYDLLKLLEETEFGKVTEASNVHVLPMPGVDSTNLQTVLTGLKYLIDNAAPAEEILQAIETINAALLLKAETSVTDTHVKSVSYNQETNTFTIIHESGTTETITPPVQDVDFYSTYGDIAELTVDRLLTANKVTKYKNTDPSEINYVWIQKQTIKLMTGTTAGTTKQHTDRNGDLLYWKDATMTEMATDPTEWPVIVYDYTELCKAEFSFFMDLESGHYVPKLSLGVGTGVMDNGKAFIYKGVTGLYLDYHRSTDGALRRIILNDDGLVLSPYELQNIDFYTNGFTAKYSGEIFSYAWTKDGEGKITALTTEDNVEIPVTWHAGGM